MTLEITSQYDIHFNRPYAVGREFNYLLAAINNLHLSGNGPFSKKCEQWLVDQTGCKKALLTLSCTAALEMAALLIDIQPGDEVIMPSYTFVSTANAFVLRGGVPVFVDIRPDTLNIDETKIEAAITERTKAIVPVHYAGVGCEMDTIMAIAERHNLLVIEDAAQGVMSSYRGRPLGSIGHLAAFSFHETKNVICGEGGALLINDPQFIERAEIIREKGTNRNQFFRGQVDKYTWVDVGSSFLPSDINAAFLYAQLEEAESITARRMRLWERYHHAFANLEEKFGVLRPIIPADCEQNAHMYYLLMPDLETRTAVIRSLKARRIHTVFHYVPLHSSPAGQRFARTSGDMHYTDTLSERLVRLPMWVRMDDDDVGQVVEAVGAALVEVGVMDKAFVR